MKVYIITGASRGIGAALAKQLIDDRHMVVCIARTKNEMLITEGNGSVQFFEQDLSKSEQLEGLMEMVLAEVPPNAESITLINNAGTVEPIGRAGDIDPMAIARSIELNLTAPMILTSSFIRLTKERLVPKKVINISSGAGRHPYSGWSSYCAGKAGLDHFSRAVATEQAENPHGVKIVSIAPGIIDTDMQAQIRSSRESEFDQVNRFIDYKEQGLLSTPQETARKLIAVMESGRFFEMDTILDLREL